jgi:hypothetical protein
MLDLAKELRPSAAFVRDVLSVAAPGFLVALELISLGIPVNETQSLHALFEYISGFGLSDASLSFVALVALGFASYVLGRGVRNLSFMLNRFGSPEQLELEMIVRDLEHAYGQENVQAVLRQHPIWASLEAGRWEPSTNLESKWANSSTPEDKEGDRSQTEMDSKRGHVFAYCKSWLRQNDPGLAVDYLETKIYVCSTLPGPLVLLAVVSARWAFAAHQGSIHFPLIVWATLTFFLLLAARGLLVEANRERCGEASQSIRNFLFSHWFSSGAPEALPHVQRPGLDDSGHRTRTQNGADDRTGE